MILLINNKSKTRINFEFFNERHQWKPLFTAKYNTYIFKFLCLD